MSMLGGGSYTNAFCAFGVFACAAFGLSENGEKARLSAYQGQHHCLKHGEVQVESINVLALRLIS
jgi:hypothetical protein